MDWIFFGDDFGAHPSTTQHLALNLPADDRVVWVNSLGMRSPTLDGNDLRRLVGKARGMLGLGGNGASPVERASGGVVAAVIEPKILPFHRAAAVRRFNRAALSSSISRATQSRGFASVAVVASNPVAVYYLPKEVDAVAYLRLDDYSRLPGVDRRLVLECEDQMIHRADAVFATARGLIPDGGDQSKWTYLEQGVDWSHFSRPLRAADPHQKVLGFFGLLARWLDYDLILAAAEQLSDWTFKMVGPEAWVDPRLKRQPNIEFVGSVPYGELPEVIAGWTAAWVPFKVDKLTEAVNPIKLRESLAAGLPTLVTPMPEAVRLKPQVHVVDAAENVAYVLGETLKNDSLENRRQRSESVRSESWLDRVGVMRSVLGKRE